MNDDSIAMHPRPTRRELLQAGGVAAAGAALTVAATATTTKPAAASPSMRFGINGHPFNAHSYNANGSTIPGVPYSTQVDMLTQMGMQTYRPDIQTDASGMGDGSLHPKLTNLHSQLDAAGMELFPMFYDNFEPTVSEADNYDLGFAKGEGLATNYGHMFTHCNLGNEWELSRHLKFDGEGIIGNDPSHYRQPRTNRALHWIRGANDGMKSVRPAAQTSVAMNGWFPTWWQQQLVDNVDPDFIDWHWYANMQRNIHALPGDITSILDFLWAKYERPIWVSESNSRSRTYPSHEQEQNEHRQVEWFNEWYAECFEHPHCEALLIHELLDNPLVPGKPFDELYYGVVKFPDIDPDTTDPEDADYRVWEWKQLGRQLAGLDHEIGGFGSQYEGWEKDLGVEFPGAQGTFTRDNTDSKGGNWSGLLTGDFSAGGNYVQIEHAIDLDLTDLRLWVRSADLNYVVLRMIDSTGQVHQQRITTVPDDKWQPLHRKTFNGGQSYVHWDGANDGVWHAPATGIALQLAKTALVAGLSGEVRFDSVIATVPN